MFHYNFMSIDLLIDTRRFKDNNAPYLLYNRRINIALKIGLNERDTLLHCDILSLSLLRMNDTHSMDDRHLFKYEVCLTSGSYN